MTATEWLHLRNREDSTNLEVLCSLWIANGSLIPKKDSIELKLLLDSANSSIDSDSDRINAFNSIDLMMFNLGVDFTNFIKESFDDPS